MRALNKTRRGEKNDLADKLIAAAEGLNEKLGEVKSRVEEITNETQEKINELIGTANGEIEDACGELEQLKEDYNEALSNWREFAGAIASEQEEYYSDRTDKWRDGEAGQAYETWKDAWSEASSEGDDLGSFDVPQIEEPDLRCEDLDEPDLADGSAFGDLPDEPES